MPAPPELLNLLDRFDQHRDAYVAGRFNETQLRRDFLDPFFEILGWDVANRKGHAEAYREVIHEDMLRIDKTIKAPDYSFRIGSDRKFFVEAKKPGVNIKDDVAPAYQVRRYAWSAKLPLSLLTDFEEWAVYDTRVKPDRLDRSTVARIQYFKYTELPEKWEEFAGVFSRDAILRGSFDKYAESAKTKKGTTLVDDAFLEEIDGWREMLAQNLALCNPELSQRDLNFAVQRTIDRIIFLRICEDRGIEEYGRLQELKDGKDVYPRLVQLFHQADAKYNSGLFHFSKEKGEAEAPDQLTPSLRIDDKVLKEIARRLYYPDSPYEFSVFSASILGHVYERFLGKVIVLDKKHKATVEEKPEVRKAGGVYYTPDYITKYIVENTVGKLVEAKEPKEVAEIKVLDPACGSGSFLIAAFDYLLDWHTRHYLANDPDSIARKKGAPIYKIVGADGVESWRLTTLEKRRILLNNIYGVDIDQQAVEVTKLSLLLKVLENETEQTLGAQMKLLHERVLPDLGNNIKNGNSLIARDIFSDWQNDDYTNEDRARVNAFDWKHEFPAIIRDGGFHAIIGNPPYVLGRETFDASVKKYLSTNFRAYGGKFDLYIYFVEKAIRLAAPTAKIGFILPNTVLVNENAIELRRMTLKETSIDTIRVFDGRVFGKAQVESVVLLLSMPRVFHSTILIEGRTTYPIAQEVFEQSDDLRFNISLHGSARNLLEEIIERSDRVSDHFDICIGIQLGGGGHGNKAAFIVPERVDESCRKVLDGRDIGPYRKQWRGKYVRYGDWLHRKRDERFFLSPKLMIRQIGCEPVATIDDEGFYTLNTIYNVIESTEMPVHVLLAVLNSALGKWIWRTMNSDFKTIFPKIKKSQIAAVPVPRLSSGEDRQNVELIVATIGTRQKLEQRLTTALSPQEHLTVEREIGEIQRRLDVLIYELFKLTKTEMSLVEGTTHE